MPSPLQIKPVLKITGFIYALIGLLLAGGGVWLAALGGSAYYLTAGLGHFGHRDTFGGRSLAGVMGLRGGADRHANLGGERSRL